MQKFEGKVAVVTGASSGIGLGLARQCAAEGMRLVVADVDETGLGKIQGELEESGAEVFAFPTDVRRAEKVEALAHAALDAFGSVDLVFNNAGVLLSGCAWERTDDDWRWVLDVNLFGVINGVRSFMPILLDQGGPAHMVNTASVGGLMAGPFLSPYIVSKHAVVALTESIYHELAALKAQVGISVLCPGPIATGIGESERIRPADRSVSGFTPTRSTRRRSRVGWKVSCREQTRPTPWNWPRTWHPMVEQTALDFAGVPFPVAIAQNSLIEFSSGMSGQLVLEVHRSRSLVAGQVIAAMCP